ncbi:MAG: DUF1722 domain-containing protein [Myxococcales bacterium]|nr:DUF1722 domain-containing protein [Myxococcales bacterium]
MRHPKPIIVASRCFGFAPCRYDQTTIPAPFFERLMPHVEFVPVCPELEIGLGVPRPTIRMERRGARVQLVQPQSGRDLSDAMERFAHDFLDGVEAVDGFWLKARSPSCAARDGKLFDPESGAIVDRRTSGRFTSVALARFADRPFCDDRRANQVALRDHYLCALFALARLREAEREGTRAALVAFHSSHKLLLMAHGQQRMRALGRIVAAPASGSEGEAFDRYRAGVGALLAQRPTRGATINAAMHVLGYFRERLPVEARHAFLARLERFRRRPGLIFAIRRDLRAFIERAPDPYLSVQAFVEPYPVELEVIMPNRRR